ncbi:20149_t:CDS:1, partial [Dentiscutata erythropus]
MLDITKVNLDKLMNTILAFKNCEDNYMNPNNANFSVNNIDIIGSNGNRTSEVEMFEPLNTYRTSEVETFEPPNTSKPSKTSNTPDTN